MLAMQEPAKILAVLRCDYLKSMCIIKEKCRKRGEKSLAVCYN